LKSAFYLIFCVFLLNSVSQAKVHIFGDLNSDERQLLLQHIKKIDEVFGFKRAVSDLSINVSSVGGVRYNPFLLIEIDKGRSFQENQLFLPNSSYLTFLTHEYTHYLVDQWLLPQSPIYRAVLFYTTFIEREGVSWRQYLANRIQSLESLSKLLGQNDRVARMSKEQIARIRNSITFERKTFSMALKVCKDLPSLFLESKVHYSNIYRNLGPIHELLADYSVAAFYDNWGKSGQILEGHLQQRLQGASPAKGVSLSEYIQLRGFPEELPSLDVLVKTEDQYLKTAALRVTLRKILSRPNPSHLRMLVTALDKMIERRYLSLSQNKVSWEQLMSWFLLEINFDHQ